MNKISCKKKKMLHEVVFDKGQKFNYEEQY